MLDTGAEPGAWRMCHVPAAGFFRNTSTACGSASTAALTLPLPSVLYPPLAGVWKVSPPGLVSVTIGVPELERTRSSSPILPRGMVNAAPAPAACARVRDEIASGASNCDHGR